VTRPPPEHTPDGRYVVIDGRRWRATDPAIPDDVAARLRTTLMSARRAVKDALRSGDSAAEQAARAQVHAVKTALGERGRPWWDQSDDERRQRWQAALQDGDQGRDRRARRTGGRTGQRSERARVPEGQRQTFSGYSE
jgi:hypothetical protein